MDTNTDYLQDFQAPSNPLPKKKKLKVFSQQNSRDHENSSQKN